MRPEKRGCGCMEVLQSAGGLDWQQSVGSVRSQVCRVHGPRARALSAVLPASLTVSSVHSGSVGKLRLWLLGCVSRLKYN